MRDLFFIAFLALMFGLCFRRPFLFVPTYIYIDLVSPQRLAFLLLNSIPLSLIAALLTVVTWLLFDNKRNSRLAMGQLLMLLLLGYAGVSTIYADYHLQALAKWDWVWRAMIFAIFVPFTLTTRLRIEAVILFMVASASSIIIIGGIKTLASGGGYGVLNLIISNNTGLYEGSIISMCAISFIPLIWWLHHHGKTFPRDWRVTMFATALTFASLLMPVGTQARTGMICVAMLGVLTLRDMKRRGPYIAAIMIAAMIAPIFLPSSFSDRFNTIKEYKADQSASTRIAVWQWTWDYALKHPLGGGFEIYRENKLDYQTEQVIGDDTTSSVQLKEVKDQARAFHSSYFEMLGEQGFPGLAIWLLIHVMNLWHMGRIRRRYKRSTDPDQIWIAPLATALQHCQLIILTGSLFVGIAWQSFVLLLLATQMGFHTYIRRLEKERQALALQGVVWGKGPPRPSAT